MTYNRLRTRILGVVMGAATVDGLSLSVRTARISSTTSMAAASGAADVDAQRYTDFIKEKVRPRRYEND